MAFEGACGGNAFFGESVGGAVIGAEKEEGFFFDCEITELGAEASDLLVHRGNAAV